MKPSKTQTQTANVLETAKAFFIGQLTIGADMEKARTYATEEFLPKAGDQADVVTTLIEAWKYPVNSPERIAELVRQRTEELVAESESRHNATHVAIGWATGIVIRDPRLSKEERNARRDQLKAMRPHNEEEQVKIFLANAAKRGDPNVLFDTYLRSVRELMNETRLQDPERRSQILGFMHKQVILHLTNMGRDDAEKVADEMEVEINSILHPPTSKPQTMAHTGRNVSTEPKARVLKPNSGREQKPKAKPLPPIKAGAVKGSLVGKPKEKVLEGRGNTSPPTRTGSLRTPRARW